MSRLVLSLALAAALSGCMSAELARVRREIGRDMPEARLASAHAPAFGRLSLGLARTVIGDDEPALRDALRHLRGVSFGRYLIGGTLDFQAVALDRTLDRVQRRGWTPAVVAREDSSASWILTRDGRDGDLRDLLVVTFEDDALTLVRIHGRLDEAALALFSGSETTEALGPLRAALGTPSANERSPQ